MMVGILVGAGVFRVTSQATAATGPSVIVAHLVLAPIVLASAVAYLVFLSTPLGLEPGGEVLHIGRTLRSARLTFVAAWLKLIAYLGAGAYLADTLALNLLELVGASTPVGWVRSAVALGGLASVFAVHVRGVRWFGRLQVGMCVVLALALLVLIVPGLFAIDLVNYRPFFTGGARGFLAALPPLFFAYAGFEALAQAAGEVRDSRAVLPRVFVRGILLTTVIFVAMSLVAFGVLPSAALGASGVPMTVAAEVYLPRGGAMVVTVGAIMAVATSLNATMFVPARLAWHLAREGHLPAVLARTHARWRTPSASLWASVVVMATLLLSGRMDLALGIAVVALLLLYALHSAALLLLPRRNPELWAQVTSGVPRAVQRAAGWISIVSLGGIVAVQFAGDLDTITTVPFAARMQTLQFTSLELLTAWVGVGLVLRRWMIRR